MFDRTLNVKFQNKVLSFGIISKITMNRKKWFDYNETLPQALPLQIFEILKSFYGWSFSMFSLHERCH